MRDFLTTPRYSILDLVIILILANIVFPLIADFMMMNR
jgi:hypothetical protein